VTSTGISTTPKAVMIVDDESDIVLIFRRSLELAGYGVFAFTDPVTALEHLKSNAGRYGLIISDVRMPGMSGIEFAIKVREIDASIPFILMSAFEMANLDIPPALNITSYLRKPVSPNQLKAIVSKYVTIAAK
jgi:CheY-like chemotaxis protein